MKVQSQISDIGSIVINFLRPEITIKCLDSLKKQTPDIKIYVGDQDTDNKKLKEYCEFNNISYIQLPFDCGIGVARNTLVDYAKKDNCKYIMWGDNDFVYDERFRVQNALIILDNDNRIGIVGGAIIKSNTVQHYERIIYYNKFYQTACFIPLEYTYPEPYYTQNIDYYYCDMTFNFCIARIEIFNNDVKWDDEIKVKFEHSFFFLKYLRYSKLRVAYCPSMMVKHEHGKNDKYDMFRYRISDGEIYAKKLNLKTGFAINEASWNHIKQDVLNFNKCAIESSTFQSALKHSLIQPKEEIKQNGQKDFKSILDIYIYLKEKNIPFVLTNKSCLEIVKNRFFNYKSKDLYIGTPNIDEMKILLFNTGFLIIENNKYNFKDFNVIIETYNGKSKIFEANSIIVNVPFPVLGYLQSKFGAKWSQIDV